MKIVVLGANSISTPWLVRYLAGRADAAPITLVLAGRRPQRLDAIARASRVLAEGSAVSIETAGAACLNGADAVLIQFRVGGYAARRFDETFPLQFDLCGDEGLGAGGLAAAWRSWPVLRDILSDVSRFCPSARVILLTSPLTTLAKVSRLAFPELDVTGVCELPFTTLSQVAANRGLAWDALDWDYLGINHIGWLLLSDVPPVPLKYLRLHYNRPEILAEQKSRPGARADELAALESPVLECYARGNREGIERAMLARPADWYDAAVGPLLSFYAGGGAYIPFFLSQPIGNGDVLELPHLAIDGHLKARPSSATPPPGIVQTLGGFLRYERAAACAVLKRDPAAIEHALSIHLVRCSAARRCTGSAAPCTRGRRCHGTACTARSRRRHSARCP